MRVGKQGGAPKRDVGSNPSGQHKINHSFRHKLNGQHRATIASSPVAAASPVPQQLPVQQLPAAAA